MIKTDPIARIDIYSGEKLAGLPQVESLSPEIRRDIRVVSSVLPFKANNYVVEQLIDWSNIPDDPIYRLTFPHRDMLFSEDYDTVAALIDRGATPGEIKHVASEIHNRMNPHPGGQLDKNVPMLDGERLEGLQHKYRETVLFFPAQGQTCHAYCGYCFRWAQFVGASDLKQKNRDVEQLTDYLRANRMVTDLLFTGGDPMVMTTRKLESYIEPILSDDLDHVQNIRIGTKALAYWPYRFTTDRDADDLMRLIERCVGRGRHVAIMAHFTHPNELETRAVEQAIRRLLNAGAVVRTQSPIVRNVNDSARTWSDMWCKQVKLNLVPYYMFVERDTGAKRYYEIPLVNALAIYRNAMKNVSGLARTVRGPSMSATPGKVNIDGICEVAGEKVFCLRFLQARNPAWINTPFFARYDEKATWIDGLEPAFGKRNYFFQEDIIRDWRDLEPLHPRGLVHTSCNGNGKRNGNRRP